MEILNQLNESQRKAVEYVDGASLVIAGAGSGKTRVLTYKIAYLLQKGMQPSTILSLTFTNKAAREMKARIAEMVGHNVARYLWMGTFHSVFSRILRKHAELLGFTRNFTIYDTSDSNSLLKSIVKELKLDEKVYKASAVHNRISHAKNNLITPEAYAADADMQQADMYAQIPRTANIYALYSARCKKADAMDFDDLLLQTNLLFRNNPDVLLFYQQSFAYILVDEYQDTNLAQYYIVKKLSQMHERICVVGDDAQSIYSFRGANIDNILQFKNAYKNTQVFKLEQNYRSTQNIVNAANSLIDKNINQIKKTVFSQNDTGSPIKLLSSFTDLEEGVVVAQNILKLKTKKDYKYSNIAILYRTNAQSRVLEDAMRKNFIPYRIYGGLSFYQRKEIKDLIAYCRLIVNPFDEEAFKRILNVPARGIGDTTLRKIMDSAQLHAVSAWEIVADMLRYNLPVSAGTASKISSFKAMIDTFAEQKETLNAYELMTSVVKVTGFIADTYTDKSVETMSRQENVQELLKAVHEFNDMKEKDGDIGLLSDFLSEVSLITDQDTDKESNAEKVTMMTIHAAKGLEFKAVFIVGVEEDLFPSAYSVDSEKSLEEERRLFYVAITRAEVLCFISYAKSRFRNGKSNFSWPSRFIRDIDEQFIERNENTATVNMPLGNAGNWDEDLQFERNRVGGFQQRNQQLSFHEKPLHSKPDTKLKKLASNGDGKASIVHPQLALGSFVKHSIFGIGKVIETTIENGNEKAEIDFGEKGKKSLLLKFAKLEILN